ncbi:formate dehydrogenase gamma subunit [Arboricoccus pini]|uniref:Formate dehydrogenase gamma subunit n=1 Tax=Arboricoccus pini TaxID=1963835 RepID=A0A212RN80_9PROT|nr:formate dehydrogenase subunit gamma [Arboricoccus pini]SNB73872.1 formate dehydrogenase gamma subunit [Arboricoccus pini]
MPANRTFDEAAIKAIIADMRSLDGPLMPILHAINDRLGYVDQRALPLIAQELNLSRAEVHGVFTFYHDFRKAPAGRHVIKVCVAEACQSMGSDRLVDHLRAAFGIGLGETTPDGRITVEPIYCLGNCALSPSAMMDGKLYGRVEGTRADRLVRSANLAAAGDGR